MAGEIQPFGVMFRDVEWPGGVDAGVDEFLDRPFGRTVVERLRGWTDDQVVMLCMVTGVLSVDVGAERDGVIEVLLTLDPSVDPNPILWTVTELLEIAPVTTRYVVGYQVTRERVEYEPRR